MKHSRLATFYLAIAGLFLTACSGERVTMPTFHAENNPEQLSDWGMVSAQGNILSLGERVTPYDLTTPLFTDYAQKLRTVWLPDGKPARYNPTDAFDFPVGTVITKTFYYVQGSSQWDGLVTPNTSPPLINGELALTGLRLIETRILVHRQNGWDALPYVWNEEQTDAVLKRTGAVQRLSLLRDEDTIEEFAYVVPNANQCAGCHATNATTKAILPIGPKARHMNKPSTYEPAFNQLDHWLTAGILEAEIDTTAPKNADWTDEAASLDERARAYLDINCSHCHNPNGAADTSGLYLQPGASGAALGHCKLPIAAGGGSGDRLFDIVPGAPEESVTIFRMESTNPGTMMPELGRSTAHTEGIALIAAWIKNMDGDCG